MGTNVFSNHGIPVGVEVEELEMMIMAQVLPQGQFRIMLRIAYFTLQQVMVTSVHAELQHGQLNCNGARMLVSNGIPTKRASICIICKHGLNNL